jgi:hypothetical protein
VNELILKRNIPIPYRPRLCCLPFQQRPGGKLSGAGPRQLRGHPAWRHRSARPRAVRAGARPKARNPGAQTAQ